MKKEKTKRGSLWTLTKAVGLLLLLGIGGWFLLWTYRLTRAVFLPGNLQIELHWVEVGLLFLLGLDLLFVVLLRLRAPRLMLLMPDGKKSRIQGPIVIGSDPGEGGLIIQGVQVSRRHLELRPGEKGKVLLRDLESTNGTRLNGAVERLQEPVELEGGDWIQLGIGGPELRISAVKHLVFLSPGWRFGMLMIFLWAGFFLGWRANVEGLPDVPMLIGNVSLGYEFFRRGIVFLGLATGLSLFLMFWSVLLKNLESGAGIFMKEVHHGVQLLLVLGAVVLYALFPAAGQRFGRAAERAQHTVDRAAGKGAYVLLQESAHAHIPPAELLKQKDTIKDSSGLESPAVQARFSSGEHSLRLASHLGQREGAALYQVTYFRQLFGLCLTVFFLIVLPLGWPSLRRFAGRLLRSLSRPLARPGTGKTRFLVYPDVLLGLAAAVIVIITVATPLGTSLGRGKKLWFIIPGLGTVQSIELVKALFILFMAGYFSRVGRLLEAAPRARYIFPFLLATGAAMATTAVQADMGGLLMLGLLVAGVFILGTGAWRLMGAVPVLVGLGLGLAAMTGKFSIITTRVGLWLDPRHHWGGSQVVEARQLLLSSGISGFSPHRALAWKIADIQGDLVIAALTERYGFLGLAALVSVWVGMALALLAIARTMGRSKTTEALLLGAVAILLSVQVFTQCGGVLGLMPFTGVPLPWLSHGLTASLIFSMILGLALAAAQEDTVSEASPALSSKRVYSFGYGIGALFFLVVLAGAYWLLFLPGGQEFGARGRGYLWVDQKRVKAVEKLIEAGIFERKGAGSRIGVNHGAYRKLRETEAEDPDLLRLLGMAEGLRWRNDKITPLPYLISNPNVFAARALPRGWILDSHGMALAMNDRRGRRIYPLGAAAFHLTGLPRGMTSGSGLESVAGGVLTGTDLSTSTRLEAYRFDVHSGADLILTLDAEMQRNAYRLLDERRGAVVVMNLKDGALLTLASSPAPDPAAGNRERRSAASDKPELNRAIASTSYYSPPGSTFKVVMAALALLNGDIIDSSEKKVCRGYDDEFDVRCAHGTAHGAVELGRALTVSCNIYFGRLAVMLGRNRLLAGLSLFGFNPEEELNLATGLPGVDFPVAPSSVEIPERGFPDKGLARVGFGQGPVSATPLGMARAGAVLATGGKLLSPYLIKAFSLGLPREDGRREILWEKEISVPKATRVIPKHVAKQLNRQLRTIFEDRHGTAHRLPALWHGPEGWRLDLKSPGEDWERVPMAGKTGSAWKTVGDRKDDAWMLVWAPAEKPRIIACVLVEDSGSGGRVAGPIAVELMRQGLKSIED